MHAMRAAVIALLAASCGRVNFDPLGGDGGGGGSGSGSGLLPDATTACVSDGFCSPTCGATDPDCQTVCGDTTCIGNAGELCTNCSSDCRTTANVCGNATCGPGEDGTTCYSDCGPVPWTWIQDENDLFTAINQARTNGTTCAGASMTTAPAVTRLATLDAAARDLAWEDSQYGTVGINRCDGQSIVAYFGQVGASAAQIVKNNTLTTTTARMNSWISDSMACPNMLMNASYTQVGVAVVGSAQTYVVLFH